MTGKPEAPEFDEFASNYDMALAEGLSISGEDKNYFANARIEWLSGLLRSLNFQPKHVVDFGCGTGSSIPFLLRLPGVCSVVGVDVSARSLQVARTQFASDNVQFQLAQEFSLKGTIDLAFCNGVFHHIQPAERDDALKTVRTALRSRGLFAFWENNPWNPGTRYVMSRIPFDRDAVPLSPRVARNLLSRSGFEIVRTDFLFYFPRALKWLRWSEPLFSSVPMGAQYQLLARRP